MPKILAIHGIGQQFKGDAVIHDEWWPSLLSGVHLAGGQLVPEDLTCAFYGDMFRPGQHLDSNRVHSLGSLTEQEKDLLVLLWSEAAQIEPERVPSPAAYDQGLAITPQIVQRALSGLSKSRFFANISQNVMLGDLKQVVGYMNNPDLRETIVQRVLEKLTDDVQIVIGHSLGSVVAYEALSRQDRTINAFITLGSPLGIRNLIFDRLQPSPVDGVGVWPPVKSWTNIADDGDVVALLKRLSDLFGSEVKDFIVINGTDAHSSERYLSSIEVGRAIVEGL